MSPCWPAERTDRTDCDNSQNGALKHAVAVINYRGSALTTDVAGEVFERRLAGWLLVVALDASVVPSIAEWSGSLAKGSKKPCFSGDHGTQSLFPRFKLKIQMNSQ
jgi:hypothetical protein